MSIVTNINKPHQMNTLYLHGLESKLNEVKRSALEKHSAVLAPDLDYRANAHIFDLLEQTIKNNTVHVIVGSSMGGLMGFHLSKMFNIPALIFNPALPFSSVGQVIPEITGNRTAFLKVIIGGQDDIVPPKNNFEWILERENGNFEVKWINSMGHQNPPEIFETEVRHFFEKLI